MKSLVYLTVLSCLFTMAQPPHNGFYFDSSETDFFKIPDSDHINTTTINDRTYETYFYANDTAARQIIFMEGSDKREVLAYIEGGYLIVGAHNIELDYTPVWAGTFFRKAILPNTWYHLALVFDNAQPTVNFPISVTENTALKWYLDGVLQDEKAGFQIGGTGNHDELFLGYKDDNLWFPNCVAWTASGLSEYCFQQTINEDGGGENYFDGYVWGFRVWNDARTATEINDNKSDLILLGAGDLVAALDGDTITYLDNNAIEQDVDNTNPSVLREWEGSQSTDWFDPLNWKNSIRPDDAKQERVFIQNNSVYYPEITTAVVVGDLELEDETTSITIKDGGTLELAYDLMIDGTIIIDEGGSLVVRESKPTTGIGSCSISRTSPNYSQPDLYSIWSTPVSQADSQLNTIFLHNIVVFKYDASQNPAAYVSVDVNENMEVGRGYFIRPDDNSGSITMTFSGALNNGVIDEAIYYNSPTDNWNLIGNPYPSSIDWLEFYDDNKSTIGGTMYYWDQSITVPNSSSDYISYNQTGSNPPGASGYIGSGQGFFVSSTQTGTVTFKNDQKVLANNAQFYGIEDNQQDMTPGATSLNRSVQNDPNDGRSWFRITGAGEYSSMLIGFIPGATDDFDSSYDGKFIENGNKLAIYSMFEGEKYDIQGRSELVSELDISVEIGFEVEQPGNYTISIDQEYINPDFDIILEDLLLNNQTDLRVIDYTFNMTGTAEDNSRFVIHYQYKDNLGIEDDAISSHDIKAYFDNNELVSVIDSIHDPASIEIHDLNGKLILSEIYKERIRMTHLSSGLYLVTYRFEEHKTITKKILKTN